MKSIYEFSNPQYFLSEYWKDKKSQNSALSIRSWAKQLGLKSHNPLYEIIRGKRNISKNFIPKFINNLNLSFKEGRYFEIMVDLQKSKTSEEKEFYLQRLNEYSPKKKLRMKELDSFQYLKNPIHTLLLELSDLKDFKADLNWIKDRLKFKTTLIEIDNALNVLLTLGLMKNHESKGLVKSQQHLYTKPDREDEALKQFHINVMDMAKEAVKEQPVWEREFNSYSINIKKNMLPDAKEKIRSFLSEFANEFEAQEATGDHTYQLSVQFFNQTK